MENSSTEHTQKMTPCSLQRNSDRRSGRRGIKWGKKVVKDKDTTIVLFES